MGDKPSSQSGTDYAARQRVFFGCTSLVVIAVLAAGGVALRDSIREEEAKNGPLFALPTPEPTDISCTDGLEAPHWNEGSMAMSERLGVTWMQFLADNRLESTTPLSHSQCYRR